MPRQGLTTERVTAAAAELADSQGLQQVTVAAVARHFGVADASLYGHVRNREALLHQVAVRAAAAFADRLALAVAGRSGRHALVGFADAYRAFAVAHPGQYAATQLQLPPEVGLHSAGHLRMIELSYATLRGYGIEEPGLTDAIRFVRSTLHGFAALETTDGFGHPRDINASWQHVVDAVHTALSGWTTMDERQIRSLRVRRAGSGDPVILLHGSGGGLHSWDPVVERLAGSFELWMPARRGYGPSEVPSGRKSFQDEIADVAAVIEAVGRPVHLVGGSYGATLALHCAAADPSRIRSLAVFEPPLFAAGPSIEPLLARYRAAFEREDTTEMGAVLNHVTRVPASIVAALAAGGRKPDPAEARRSAIGWLHDLEALADDSTAIDRWSAIRVPTLLMQGADTWEPMPTTMNALAATLPSARRVIWAGQSHFATMTGPDLVAGALREFFDEVPA